MSDQNKTNWSKLILSSLISAASMAVVGEVSRVVVDAIKKKLDKKNNDGSSP